MRNYYNDIDAKACAWTQELINAGLIPPGVVDCCSINDITYDLSQFTQCHFFNGISGWAHALDIAGWPRDKPIWCASCPCQPFSAAGKGEGQKDERHLWPAFFRLVCKYSPNIVIGEQVANAIGHGWLDGVQADLESENFAVGHCVLGAACVGAPHIRQRLYWVANSQCAERRALDSSCGDGGRDVLSQRREGPSGVGVGGEDGGLEHAPCNGREQWRPESGGRGLERGCGPGGGLGEPNSPGRQPGQPSAEAAGHGHAFEPAGCDGRVADPEASGPPCGGSGGVFPIAASSSEQGAWDNFDLIPCLDGKARRVGAGVRVLASGVPGRVGLLRGYGNAIVPQVAAQFIRAYQEAALQIL